MEGGLKPSSLYVYLNVKQYHCISRKLNQTKKHTSMIKCPSSCTSLASLCIIIQHAAHKRFWEQPGLTEVGGKFEIAFRGARMKVSNPIDFSKKLIVWGYAQTWIFKGAGLWTTHLYVFMNWEKYFKSGCNTGISFKWNYVYYFIMLNLRYCRFTEMSVLDQQVSVPCC